MEERDMRFLLLRGKEIPNLSDRLGIFIIYDFYLFDVDKAIWNSHCHSLRMGNKSPCLIVKIMILQYCSYFI